MKQPKQDEDRTYDRQGGTPTGTRPSKPLPGETAHHLATVPPLSGPVKGEGPRAPDGVSNGRRAKAAFDPAAGRPQESTGGDTDRPRQEPVGGQRVGRPGEQYVRLRVRVRGDRLSVVDSHLVEGPLSQSAVFHGANAYDVTYGDRLLHAGTVPDLAVQRSFPNPEGPPEQHGHHLASHEVAEFSARVPAHELTAETIGGIRIGLHHVAETTTTRQLGAEPLAVQFEGRMRPIAELIGLPDSALPESIAARGGRTAQGSAD